MCPSRRAKNEGVWPSITSHSLGRSRTSAARAASDARSWSGTFANRGICLSSSPVIIENLLFVPTSFERKGGLQEFETQSEQAESCVDARLTVTCDLWKNLRPRRPPGQSHAARL